MQTFVAGLVCGCLVALGTPVLALTITPTDDALTLTTAILGTDTTRVGALTYRGAGGAAGTFRDGLTAGIGIDAGIVLTTGAATNALGPNKVQDTTTEHYGVGDADLTMLSGLPTFDAAVLEFTLVTDGGPLFLNYVFASEEYNEFVSLPFHDVFGLFLDGRNIALTPGSTDPVTINTMNASTPEIFHDNTGLHGPRFDLEYDGFTTVLTTVAMDLSAGEHTMKLAIADVGDFVLDSAVFIQTGTFSLQGASSLPPTASTPEPASWWLLGSGLVACLGYRWQNRRRKL
jgi:hypothetical protein